MPVGTRLSPTDAFSPIMEGLDILETQAPRLKPPRSAEMTTVAIMSGTHPAFLAAQQVLLSEATAAGPRKNPDAADSNSTIEEERQMKFVFRVFGAVAFVFLTSCATSASSGMSGLSVRNPETVPWPPESMTREWSFERDTQGRMTMTREWPYGAVDKNIRFILSDGALAPISGVNVYPNRHVRDMSDREMRYYWEYGGGRHAAEQHRGGASSQ